MCQHDILQDYIRDSCHIQNVGSHPSQDGENSLYDIISGPTIHFIPDSQGREDQVLNGRYPIESATQMSGNAPHGFSSPVLLELIFPHLITTSIVLTRL